MAVQSSPFLTRQLELTSPSISRMAPLLYVYRDDPEELIASTGAQTAFTHNNLQVIKSAEFFSTVTYQVLQGASPVTAIEHAKRGQINSDLFFFGMDRNGDAKRRAGYPASDSGFWSDV